MVKLRITALLLVLLTALSLCSCQQSEDKKKKLVVYCVEADKEYYVKNFNTYNNYCVAKGLGWDYQVEVMTFKNSSELNKKMTTEIMAGGGPDLFLTSQVLPFEKMVESEMFADINELAKQKGASLDLSGYNENVMSCGVYDGKRYIVPLLYTPNASYAYSEALSSVGLEPKQNCALTYNDAETLKKLSEKMDSLMLDYTGYTEEFFERFVCDYVDFEKKEVYFETDEFKKNIDLIKQLCVKYEERERKKIPDYYRRLPVKYLSYDGYQTPLFYSKIYTLPDSAKTFVYQTQAKKDSNITKTVYDRESADNSVVCRGIQRNKDEILGTVQLGVAVNKNSDKKEKALAFVEYGLSEYGQTHLTSPFNSAFSAMAVKKSVFDKRMQDASEVEAENRELGLDSEIMKATVEVSKSVQKCSLGREYYSKNIAGGLIRKYLAGQLPKYKFIRQLKTATKFYLEE